MRTKSRVDSGRVRGTSVRFPRLVKQPEKLPFPGSTKGHDAKKGILKIGMEGTCQYSHIVLTVLVGPDGPEAPDIGHGEGQVPGSCCGTGRLQVGRQKPLEKGGVCRAEELLAAGSARKAVLGPSYDGRSESLGPAPFSSEGL